MNYPEIFISEVLNNSETPSLSEIIIEWVKDQIKWVLIEINEYLVQRKILSIQKNYPKFSTEKIQEILHNSVIDPVSRSNEAQRLLQLEKLSWAQSLAIEHMHMAWKLFAKPWAELTASLKAKIKAWNAVFDTLIADLNQKNPVPTEEIQRLEEERKQLMEKGNIKRLMDEGILWKLNPDQKKDLEDISEKKSKLQDILDNEENLPPAHVEYINQLETAFIEVYSWTKSIAEKSNNLETDFLESSKKSIIASRKSKPYIKGLLVWSTIDGKKLTSNPVKGAKIVAEYESKLTSPEHRRFLALEKKYAESTKDLMKKEYKKEWWVFSNVVNMFWWWGKKKKK